MTKLKPCPFCGAPAEIEADSKTYAMIQCSNWETCGAELSALDGQKGGDAFARAKRRWNRRAADQPEAVVDPEATVHKEVGRSRVARSVKSSVGG